MIFDGSDTFLLETMMKYAGPAHEAIELQYGQRQVARLPVMLLEVQVSDGSAPAPTQAQAPTGPSAHAPKRPRAQAPTGLRALGLRVTSCEVDMRAACARCSALASHHGQPDHAMRRAIVLWTALR